MKEFITTAEVAAILGVSAATVKRWADKGLIAVQGRTVGRHRLFVKSSVEVFKSTMNTKTPGEPPKAGDPHG